MWMTLCWLSLSFLLNASRIFNSTMAWWWNLQPIIREKQCYNMLLVKGWYLTTQLCYDMLASGVSHLFLLRMTLMATSSWVLWSRHFRTCPKDPFPITSSTSKRKPMWSCRTWIRNREHSIGNVCVLCVWYVGQYFWIQEPHCMYLNGSSWYNDILHYGFL